MIKTTISLMCVFISGCAACFSQNVHQWESLFNGENLDNWEVKIRGHDLGDNFANTFRVDDGILQIRYNQFHSGFEDKYGHIFYKNPFSTYLIGVEYRFVGARATYNPGQWAYRNNGIMVHGQDPKTMGIDHDFPESIEVQLFGGHGAKERSTANLCTPGTRYIMDGELITTQCKVSSSNTFYGDQWGRVEVLVLRDSLIVHYANRKEIIRYEAPQSDNGKLLQEGTISLQSEPHPTDFRKVEIVI